MTQEISFGFYIKSAISFKYISNFSIICAILSYYMNGFDIFFIFAPLVIVNFLVINIMQIVNFDELMEGLLGGILPDKVEREKHLAKFILFSELWHIIPVIWIMYVLQSDGSNLIKIFHPNYMGIFFKSSIISLIYYYFQCKQQIYGDVNYLAYLVVYSFLLLAICIYLYS